MKKSKAVANDASLLITPVTKPQDKKLYEILWVELSHTSTAQNIYSQKRLQQLLDNLNKVTQKFGMESSALI